MADESILHQDDVEDVVAEVIESSVGENQAAIANVASPSGTYVQAEAVAARNAINSILAALRANGLIDT